MKFDMKIDSDNADNGPEMVADNLRRIATLIVDGYDAGQIRDRNGNPVGSWELTP